MAKIIEFPAPMKLGLKRARTQRSTRGKHTADQLSLFDEVEIFEMPLVQMSTFEQALILDEQDDSKALELYRKAIAEGECVADAYCNLGVLESVKGRHARSIDNFTKALRADARHYESHYNLGNLYFEAGDLSLAQLHYEVTVEINPDFPNTFFNLGLVHAINEAYLPAMDALMRYRELVPGEEGGKADDLLRQLKQSIAKER